MSADIPYFSPVRVPASSFNKGAVAASLIGKTVEQLIATVFGVPDVSIAQARNRGGFASVIRNMHAKWKASGSVSILPTVISSACSEVAFPMRGSLRAAVPDVFRVVLLQLIDSAAPNRLPGSDLKDWLSSTAAQRVDPIVYKILFILMREIFGSQSARFADGLQKFPSEVFEGITGSFSIPDGFVAFCKNACPFVFSLDDSVPHPLLQASPPAGNRSSDVPDAPPTPSPGQIPETTDPDVIDVDGKDVSGDARMYDMIGEISGDTDLNFMGGRGALICIRQAMRGILWADHVEKLHPLVQKTFNAFALPTSGVISALDQEVANAQNRWAAACRSNSFADRPCALLDFLKTALPSLKGECKLLSSRLDDFVKAAKYDSTFSRARSSSSSVSTILVDNQDAQAVANDTALQFKRMAARIEAFEQAQSNKRTRPNPSPGDPKSRVQSKGSPLMAELKRMIKSRFPRADAHAMAVKIANRSCLGCTAPLVPGVSRCSCGSTTVHHSFLSAVAKANQ